MRAVVYDKDTGEILRSYSGSAIPSHDASKEGVIHNVTGRPMSHYVDIATLQVHMRNPADITATWTQIKAKRNALEISPITLDNGLAYDYDQQAKLRFETALSQFDNLPTLIDDKLAWKLFDNSFELLTKSELQAVYDELQTKSAIRSAMLFVKAEELNLGNVTAGEIEELETWGLT